MSLDEFGLIDHIARRTRARADVALGIGDDAALLQPPPGMQLAVATDTLNIGIHFPPSDARWKGADSRAFVRHCDGLIRARGWRIGNCDITVICERPKVGPHAQAMREAIASDLGIEPDAVSVKATTTEALGFTGRGEGIAAQAVCLLVCDD